jgi:hypothetical protein
LGVVSLKPTGSYLVDAIRNSHLFIDFIAVYENVSTDKTEEAKQLESIRTKVKEMFVDSKFTIDTSSSEDKVLVLSYSLSNNTVLKIIFYFQNIFSEESYTSLEHWKNLSKEFPQFETKHKALFKLLRIWRYTLSKPIGGSRIWIWFQWKYLIMQLSNYMIQISL